MVLHWDSFKKEINPFQYVIRGQETMTKREVAQKKFEVSQLASKLGIEISMVTEGFVTGKDIPTLMIMEALTGKTHGYDNIGSLFYPEVDQETLEKIAMLSSYIGVKECTDDSDRKVKAVNEGGIDYDHLALIGLANINTSFAADYQTEITKKRNQHIGENGKCL